jgi:hypothetical protein
VTNPTQQDFRWDADDHIRGVKNVLKLTFPALDAAVTASHTELNLLVGETVLGGGEPAGTIMAFDQAAAPTGWTQDTATSNLADSTIRMETGVAGGAVAGTHGFDTPPSNSHTHTDTLAFSDTTVGTIYLPDHDHTTHQAIDESDSSEDIYEAYCYAQRNNSGDNYRYDMCGGSGLTPNGGRSSAEGGDASHGHAMSGSITTQSGTTQFAPKYFTVIICEKD